MFDSSAAKERFLTPSEIAQQWRCTSHHVRALVRSGRLRGFYIGSKLIVKERDIADFLERHATTTAKAAQNTKTARVIARRSSLPLDDWTGLTMTVYNKPTPKLNSCLTPARPSQKEVFA